MLANHFHFDPQKLYATVYQGNSELGIAPDNESIEFWKSVGLPEDHIVPLGEDNFWGPAGQTGPCGPCTEVFFDTGDEYGPRYTPGGHFDDVNRYIEIWNAGVFMELNKMADGTFESLPLKSVDTGSGVERMYLAMNGCDTLYDVDTIKPIYDLARKKLTAPGITEKEIRMVTDHIRSSTFILSEGVKPDKDGRGYIVRRLIRKCITVAVRAKVSPMELVELSDEVVHQLKEFYPHMGQNHEQITRLLTEEIHDFEPVIKSGLQLLDEELAQTSNKQLSGEQAFKLVATFGVPFEIIKDYALAKSVEIDEKEYEKLYEEHQKISREGVQSLGQGESQGAHLEELTANLNPTEFAGYEGLETKAKVLAIISEGEKVNQAAGQCFVITDKTTFYAEGGGQAGDQGTISHDNLKATIQDVKSYHNVYVHQVQVDEGALKESDEVTLCVDSNRRARTSRNHSATHLLHSALRTVLGDHVVQKGSLVNTEKLRFDFQHSASLSAEEIQKVESLVNQWIWSASSSQISTESYQDAIGSGVIALFGEKYQDDVRVVRFGDFSGELCAGTHVANTGQIGLFKIVTEGSSAKGIRRIEAITGEAAFNHLSQSDHIVSSAQKIIGVDRERLLENISLLKSSNKKSKQMAAPASQECEIKELFESKSGLKAAFVQIAMNKKELIDFGEELLKNEKLDVVFMASPQGEKLMSVVIVAEGSTEKVKANSLLNEWIAPFDGKGGGKATVAQGGINRQVDPEELQSAAMSLFSAE